MALVDDHVLRGFDQHRRFTMPGACRLRINLMHRVVEEALGVDDHPCEHPFGLRMRLDRLRHDADDFFVGRGGLTEMTRGLTGSA